MFVDDSFNVRCIAYCSVVVVVGSVQDEYNAITSRLTLSKQIIRSKLGRVSTIITRIACINTGSRSMELATPNTKYLSFSSSYVILTSRFDLTDKSTSFTRAAICCSLLSMVPYISNSFIILFRTLLTLASNIQILCTQVIFVLTFKIRRILGNV